MPDTTPLLLDSITDAGAEAQGAVAVSGSHGGMYPAGLASACGLRGVIFNDAGGGLDRAGVAGVLALDGVGLAAAAADAMSCRIGDTADMMRHGVLSTVNDTAKALGLAPGQAMADAAELLRRAGPPTGTLDSARETRSVRTLPSGLEVRLYDSAAMVGPADVGAVVVTGSHGGLVGGDPARALKAAARLAVFNDAGRGKDDVGLARLPALETRGIAALTVAHDSARIGDAVSALETGTISAVNRPAAGMGARIGAPLMEFLAKL